MNNKEGEKKETIKIRDKRSKRNLKHNNSNTHQSNNLEIEMIKIRNQMNMNLNNKIERRKRRRRIKIKIEKEIDQVRTIIKTKRRKRKERNKENNDNKDNKIHPKMTKKDLNQKKVQIHLMMMNNPTNHKKKEEKDKNPRRKIQSGIKMMTTISISMILSSSDQN